MNDLLELQCKITKARAEIHKRVIGNEELIQALLLCMFSTGVATNPHLLITGKTGVAKTTLANTAGSVFGFSGTVLETEEIIRRAARRIDGNGEPQASDIIGYKNLAGDFIEGPIFTNLLIADEFNRFYPGTRSALLTPMAEGFVTVEGVMHKLPEPFMVIATQNPTSYRGTHALLPQENDRFIFSVFVGWPTVDEHLEINYLNTQPPSKLPSTEAIFSPEEIISARELIASNVFASRMVRRYAILMARQLLPEESHVKEVKAGEFSIVDETSIVRGANDLVVVARTLAAFRGDLYVTPEHVDAVAHGALSHRITYRSGKEPNSEGIHQLMKNVVRAAHRIGV